MDENSGQIIEQPGTGTKTAQGRKTESQLVKRMKSLIASPHFKFQQIVQPSAEIDPGFSPTQDSAPENDRIRETPIVVPAKAQLLAADKAKNDTRNYRIDEALKNVPTTHLPDSSLSQFVGWSESIISAWENADITVADEIPSGTKEPLGFKIDKPKSEMSDEGKPVSTPSPWVEEAETFRQITNFDQSLGYGIGKMRLDPEHPKIESQLGEHPLSVESETRSRFTQQTVLIQQLVKQAFSEPLPADVTAIPNVMVPVTLPGSLIQQKTAIERRASIREVAERPWSEICDKMLGRGLPVLQKLADAIRQKTSPAICETVIAGLTTGCGSTTVAMSLARHFASQGESVLLVDADIRTAGLTRALELTDMRSWVTLVRSHDFLDKGVVKTRESHISIASVAPLRLRTLWPSFILDHLANLLGTVYGVFDRVLIDVGTTAQLLSELSGQNSLAANALVVAQGGTIDEETAIRVRTNLIGVGIEHFLVAQNFAKRKPA